jgi:hypothetical protein
MTQGVVVIPPKVREIAVERDWTGPVWSDPLLNLPYSQAGTYLYQEGLVAAAGWRGPLLSITVVKPWREVTTLRHGWSRNLAHDLELGSVVLFTDDTFDVKFADGTSAGFSIGRMPHRTLAADYFEHGPRPDRSGTNAKAVEAVALVEATVAEALMPTIRQELEEGRMVSFGALSATLDGVACGGQSFGWDDITTLELEPDAPWPTYHDLHRKDGGQSQAMLNLRWKAPGGTDRHRIFSTDEVWNLKALQKLRQTLARPNQ